MSQISQKKCSRAFIDLPASRHLGRCVWAVKNCVLVGAHNLNGPTFALAQRSKQSGMRFGASGAARKTLIYFDGRLVALR